MDRENVLSACILMKRVDVLSAYTDMFACLLLQSRDGKMAGIGFGLVEVAEESLGKCVETGRIALECLNVEDAFAGNRRVDSG